PRSALALAAMTSGPLEPSSRLATRYSSLDSWITCPSARRTSDGGSVAPLFLNSPSNSAPWASRGGQARSAGAAVTVGIPSLAAGLHWPRAFTGRRPSLAAGIGRGPPSRVRAALRLGLSYSSMTKLLPLPMLRMPLPLYDWLVKLELEPWLQHRG